VAAAPKKIASRYYQLKVGHAAIGVFLHRIRARDSAACQWCLASRETVYHLLFECREWRRQWERLYKALERAKVARPSVIETCAEGRLLENSRASEALLDARERVLRERMGASERTSGGWRPLEEAERDGEG